MIFWNIILSFFSILIPLCSENTLDMILIILNAVGRTMFLSKDVHILIPKTCKYVTFCGQEELRSQMELNLFTSWLWEGKSILYYPGGPDMVKKVILSGRGRQKGENQWDGGMKKTQPNIVAIVDGL